MEVGKRSTEIADDAMNVVKKLVGDGFDPTETYGEESLPQELIAEGDIRCTLIAKTETYKVSLLTMYPHSATKEHPHMGESEWLYDITNKTIKVCANGEMHSLRNDTDDIKFVISVKYKEG